jgi:chromosome segregation ATPase
MKRILLCTLIAAALPALAQVTANPNAKVDPKNNKVSRPVVEKPKQKLMTRDELRACLQRFDKNEVQAKEIKAAQAANAQERSELTAFKEAVTKEGEALTASANAIKAERDDLLKEQEGLKEKMAKLERADAEKVLNEYKARATAHDAKIEAYNQARLRYSENAKSFDGRADAFNTSNKNLQERAEAHLDEVDNWKEDCSNKPYDEADEIAVRKELGQTKK